MKLETLFDENNILKIDLFHGTSTLFLKGIIEKGLGGINPVVDWNLIELSKEVFELSKIHLKDSELFIISSLSLKAMSEQTNYGAFNFQHGNSYLSPSQQTAINYAVKQKYGSEILSYIIIFLEELLKLDIAYVKNDLSRKFSNVFKLMKLSPSPILIQIKNIPTSSLQTEHGEDPSLNFVQIQNFQMKSEHLFDILSQQTNFRLINTIPKNDLIFWLIDITEFNGFSPDYKLYELLLPD
ncbi:MAG: hypothetical protein M3Q58_11320 [Bacteroidota bacterium]|nr:hypothetical protein [Bacteroidota bacterium]